ncbi:MAG: AMP-dependent synthetase/ligase [Alphaproteobacteria bacterium]
MADKMGDYAQRYNDWRTLTQVFLDKAEELGDKPLFRAKRGEDWISTSWSEARDAVAAFSGGLRAIGVEPGDRVALVAENRPEWAIADIAIMAAGAITVPAYTTNTVDDHAHILSDSGARVAIVSTPKLADRLMPAARQAAGCEAVVMIDPPDGELRADGLSVYRWADILAKGRDAPGGVADMTGRGERGDTACLIYTSGTGGAPKGVMLAHGAILCNCVGAYHLFADSGLLDVDREVFLSFLPLSHSYEHTAGLFFPITIGAEIYYAESAERLVANMAEARPTIMTAVPRLYETMHQRILSGVDRKGGLSARMFHRTVEIGRKRYEQGAESLGLAERLQDRILDRLVRTKVAARFGGRLKAFVSGGAPLSYDIGTFFLALGVRLLQGYGQTETAPVVSCNPLNDIRIATVGPPFPGVEVKIAEDGEILVRGELNMRGYWNRPEETAAVLRDGWVHTGDIGLIDEGGYIRITDRKKDIIVNSGGDNLSPQRVEGCLTATQEIAQAMVYGDRRPHLVALLVPDHSFVEAWSARHGRPADLAELADDPEFQGALQPIVDRVNQRLSRIEQVRRFAIATEPFTTENAMMTPSLKIRRHVITDRYGDRLEGLY